MISKKRIEFWNNSHIISKQGNSIAFPLESIENWQKYFKEKEVLEIGPGEERQGKIIKKLCKQYSIADISKTCMDKIEANNKFLITNYEQDFNYTFDTICLFYVFHHVIDNEIDVFLKFLYRHLKNGGHLCFNVATIGQKSDGITTTKYDLNSFKNKITVKHKFKILDEYNSEKKDNYIFVLEKNNDG